MPGSAGRVPARSSRASARRSRRSADGARSGASRSSVTKVGRPRAEGRERYRRVSDREPGDLHAPVLRHDRRRPAARAVPRAARQGRAGQAARRGDRQGRAPTSRPARRWPTRWRSGRTRSTRSTRNMVAAGEAGGILDTILKRLVDVHREAGQAQVAGPVRDDLSDRRAQHRGRSSSSSSCGRSSRRSRRCSKGLGAKLPLADARRHLGEQEDRSSACRS